MKMNNYNAVGIAEGFIECDNEKTIIKAWQYLIDTGLAFKLQGSFGRTAVDLINQGICKKKESEGGGGGSFQPTLGVTSRSGLKYPLPPLLHCHGGHESLSLFVTTTRPASSDWRSDRFAATRASRT